MLPGNLWGQDVTAAEKQCDYLVIGSGAAGLASALCAARSGLAVIVAEKSDLLGGTSAMSGAGIWVPANHLARAAGLQDSPAEALEYLHAALPPAWAALEAPLWAAYTEAAPRCLRFLADQTPLQFELIPEPDPFAERPGGKQMGRMLSVRPLSRWRLGRLARRLRPSTLVHLFSYREMVTRDPYHHPIRAGLGLLPRLVWRWLTNSGGQGSALMTGLIRGCLDAGVTFLPGTAAQALLQDDSGAVTGAQMLQGGAPLVIHAARGVLIASGGFEWDDALRRRHFPGPVDALGSPATNTGDGQRMAAAAGAALDRMDQANIYPCLPTVYEGRPTGLPFTFQAEAHSILVNRHGQRFANETDFNIGEAMDARDPETGAPLHLPVWLIGDRRFLRQSIPFHWFARYRPGWVIRADTLAELATRTGLPGAALEQTVARYNGFCAEGADRDFRRGQSAWDSYKSHGASQPLTPITKGPFVALSVNRAILGTKGGARTNDRGQVLRPDGSIIAGLYAAGLAMANPIGTRAVGPGTTLGPNMTWGFICAETLLRQNRAPNQNGEADAPAPDHPRPEL